jgi:hypothetical protein
MGKVLSDNLIRVWRDLNQGICAPRTYGFCKFLIVFLRGRRSLTNPHYVAPTPRIRESPGQTHRSLRRCAAQGGELDLDACAHKFGCIIVADDAFAARQLQNELSKV